MTVHELVRLLSTCPLDTEVMLGGKGALTEVDIGGGGVTLCAAAVVKAKPKPKAEPKPETKAEAA